MILKKTHVIYIVIFVLVSNTLVAVSSNLFTSKMDDLQCDQIIKSRAANDLITLEMNRSDAIMYFDAFEIANTVKEIGKNNEIKSNGYLCKFWSDNFKRIIFSTLDKKTLESKESVHLTKEYEEGVKILDQYCRKKK